MSIIIFSKPVHSGKTSALLEWSKKQKNIAGILMPDMDGERKMLDIRLNEIFDAECKDAHDSKKSTVNIGRFYFYAASFEKANSILINEMAKAPEWLVIDEVGRLEMDGKGFYPALKKLIPVYQSALSTSSLLLVIRDSLVEKICSFFEIKDPVIVDTLP